MATSNGSPCPIRALSAVDVLNSIDKGRPIARSTSGRTTSRIPFMPLELSTRTAADCGAASSLAGAAGRLDHLLGQLDQPVDDFAATGLYEFTQLIGETRQLVAALGRITKEFERDPAGFLIGR